MIEDKKWTGRQDIVKYKEGIKFIQRIGLSLCIAGLCPLLVDQLLAAILLNASLFQ